jgi:hypothetical protein
MAFTSSGGSLPILMASMRMGSLRRKEHLPVQAWFAGRATSRSDPFPPLGHASVKCRYDEEIVRINVAELI